MYITNEVTHESQDCNDAGQEASWYEAGLMKLLPYAEPHTVLGRDNALGNYFKREDFEVRSMDSDNCNNLVLSPCARMTRISMSNAADVPALDDLFQEFTSWRVHESACAPTGFLGALRFFDSDTATVAYVSFWNCDATLRASAIGHVGSRYNQFVTKIVSYADGPDLVCERSEVGKAQCVTEATACKGCRAKGVNSRYFQQLFLPAGLQGDLDRVEYEMTETHGHRRQRSST